MITGSRWTPEKSKAKKLPTKLKKAEECVGTEGLQEAKEEQSGDKGGREQGQDFTASLPSSLSARAEGRDLARKPM